MSLKRLLSLGISFSFLSSLFLLFTNASPQSEDVSYYKGLKDWTEEEGKKLHKSKIKKVRPNKIAIDRINKMRKEKGLPDLEDPKPGEKEFELDSTESNGATSLIQESTSLNAADTAMALATIDNSTLPYFPPIGTQGAQNSCVAWASTYYLMSHEVCLTLGCDNKSTSTYRFSPKWTYNMINSGVDNGSSFSDSFPLMQKHGAATLLQLPYNATDFKSWDLTASNWKSAVNYRMSQINSVQINTDTAMANVKQLLTNGHVLVIGTYINSWQYRTVQENPNTLETDPYVGQSIATYINGSLGGHAMTIVGYNDSIWTDINSNGLVESGELGAFKIANSWGTSWKNAGFVWASYDSFRSISSVPNFAPTGRIQLTQGGYAYFNTYAVKTIKALAKVSLSHLMRSQFSLNLATSLNTTQTPQTYFNLAAFTNDGGAFALNGSTIEVPGTFYFDLTDIIGTSTDLMYYLILNDITSLNPLTIQSFEIIDPSNNSTLFSASNIPLTVDAQSNIKLTAGNYSPDLTPPTAPTNLTGTVSSVKKGKTIVKTVKLNWFASTDNVGVSNYRIYRNGILYSTVSSSTLTFSDTAVNSGVSYVYEVAAIDSSNNLSLKSNKITLIP